MSTNDDLQHTLQFIKDCDIDDLKNLITTFILNLNYHDCQWEIGVGDEHHYATTINPQNAKCLITIRQYSILTIGPNELQQFIDILKSKNIYYGVFITTSSFSKEANAYANNINASAEFNIHLIDGLVISRYLQNTKSVNHKQNNSNQGKKSTHLRIRNSKKFIRVTFPDGTVFCDKNVSVTLSQTIKHIGVELVASLGLEVCHIPLVSQTINKQYEEWIRPLGNGWYIMIQGNTDQKFMQLLSINNQLSLNMIIEMGSDLETTTNSNKRTSKKTKTQLLITFPNGEIIAGSNTTETFINFINYIGIDKIEKKNIIMTNKQLITTANKYNGQVQHGTGKWITVPNTSKDKYKLIKVIGSMMHVNFDITII